jgi:hypothetical protein
MKVFQAALLMAAASAVKLQEEGSDVTMDIPEHPTEEDVRAMLDAFDHGEKDGIMQEGEAREFLKTIGMSEGEADDAINDALKELGRPPTHDEIVGWMMEEGHSDGSHHSGSKHGSKHGSHHSDGDHHSCGGGSKHGSEHKSHKSGSKHGSQHAHSGDEAMTAPIKLGEISDGGAKSEGAMSDGEKSDGGFSMKSHRSGPKSEGAGS